MLRHRYDAENAAGIPTTFDPKLAVDGIEEMLVCMAPRKRGFLDTRTLAIHATDVDERWHVTLTPEDVITSRNDDTAEATLVGTASDFYLALWDRGDDSGVTITGDHKIIEEWRETKEIQWPGEERAI